LLASSPNRKTDSKLSRWVKW